MGSARQDRQIRARGKAIGHRGEPMADVPGKDPRRNIVVFADGTGNSAAKAFKTNVWRLYQALDLTGADQIAVFSDGVGTSQFKPFEIIGLALGFGVKRRVLALYKFLCLNYEPGDRIFAFGFSRGAFTIRVLVGMIAREGLVKAESEEELDRNAHAAYRAYRPKAFGSKLPWVVSARYIAQQWFAFWNQITGSRPYDQVKPNGVDPRAAKNIRIAFVGVWDTVAAYGLPVDELTKAVHKWVWPITFEKRNLLRAVRCARQAFSIDDERRTFFPIPWDESGSAKEEDAQAGPAANRDVSGAEDEKDADPRLKQVWFAGCHANVGGGYADDRLAHIPLCWMIGEAAEQKLRFKTEVVADYWDYASEAGRIYDSRSGFGVFYRYHPRNVKDLMGRGVTPLVDASVITRIAKGSDDYAPISLPEEFDVLTPLGFKVPFTDLIGGRPVPTAAGVVDKLKLPEDRKRDLATMNTKFGQALGAFKPQSAEGRTERFQLTKDTVWWRRGLYYVMLSIAVLFAAFPLLAGYVTLGATGQLEQAANGLAGPVIGLISGFLPGLAAPWVDAVTTHSGLAAILVVALGFFLWVNGVLRTRIDDRARLAWNVDRGQGVRVPPSDRNDAHRRSALIGAVVLGFCALAAGRPWEHSFILEWKSIAETAWIAWAGLFLAVASLGCLATYLFLSARGPRAASTPVSLVIARAIRNNHGAQRLYKLLREYLLPAAFLALSAYLVVCAVNKTIFEVADSMGTYCAEPVLANSTGVERLSATSAGFKTNAMCSDTGNWLQEGVRYEVIVTIDPKDPWIDGEKDPDPIRDRGCADTMGVAEGSLVHYLASLLKRWWAEPYFKPIARIGRFGNDEYALDPVGPTTLGKCLNMRLTAEIKPKNSGELYFYVNDAVIALPGVSNFFYRHNNLGSAEVSVKRVNVFP
ncbi:DUF2235 domain-containing protein [Mesorhizobium japonicum]|uniref:DUF2235 domain-containing protein n=1 Tax=Mesorhizobium TaxID=68287 RepID=UPI001463DAB0|nr:MULTISPECIES: DUF2235 domain-containing protein [Mesorhizobium]MBE1710917.1 DUF2235 domain-containing protein [Mesorhizobium japonicum]MBE1715415.1 DUF2235 domain-containing protein [Mesorhizobium japonicum]QJI89700.1 DUF2235 domain-containing protein [Mesorhizobium japonicum]